MKKLTYLVAMMLVLTATTRVRAQDDAAMKAWQAYMTPGNVHQMIAKSDGNWNEDITMWMTPGAPPTKSKSTCVNTMILGGRYQQSIHKGNMMGMPFEGVGLLGYDNAKKIFVSTWIDNFGTGMMYMEGTWDNASKSITFKGSTVDPSTGKDMNVREVMKFIDDKNMLMEMYATVNGNEMKTMEIKISKN